MSALWLRIVAFVTPLMTTAIAFADEGAEEAAAGDATIQAAAYLSAGLAIGIAAAGGGMGQGRTAAAALEGIARNPNASDKLFTPMILGLALIESLVIYALVVSFMLLLK